MPAITVKWTRQIARKPGQPIASAASATDATPGCRNNAAVMHSPATAPISGRTRIVAETEFLEQGAVLQRRIFLFPKSRLDGLDNVGSPLI
jgi:hypothetical protein